MGLEFVFLYHGNSCKVRVRETVESWEARMIEQRKET